MCSAWWKTLHLVVLYTAKKKSEHMHWWMKYTIGNTTERSRAMFLQAMHVFSTCYQCKQEHRRGVTGLYLSKIINTIETSRKQLIRNHDYQLTHTCLKIPNPHSGVLANHSSLSIFTFGWFPSNIWTQSSAARTSVWIWSWKCAAYFPQTCLMIGSTIIGPLKKRKITSSTL